MLNPTEAGMATEIPNAVAINASEIAGATTASSADPIFPIAVNALIIPITVPKTPRNGAILEIVAKYAKLFSRRSRICRFTLSIVRSSISFKCSGSPLSAVYLHVASGNSFANCCDSFIISSNKIPKS